MKSVKRTTYRREGLLMKNKKYVTVLFLMILSMMLVTNTFDDFIAQADVSWDQSEAQSLSFDNEEENASDQEAVHTDQTIQKANPAQWNHQLMNIQSAWADGYTGKGVNVAILDTGFHADHPEIHFAGGTSIYEDDPWTNDHTGHGTHIAGIIGAKSGTEFQGIAPDVNLYGVKIYHRNHVDENGAPYTSIDSIVKGIYAAIELNAQIIVISSGVPTDNPSLHQAVKAATNSGALIFAAGGNNAHSVQYPAAYDEVIAVASVDQNIAPASDLTAGPENDFVAPGVDIGGLSTPGSAYGYPHIYMSGSSQAAPHVAGLAALLVQKNHYSTNAALNELNQSAIAQGDSAIYGKGLAHYQSKNEKTLVAKHEESHTEGL